MVGESSSRSSGSKRSFFDLHDDSKSKPPAKRVRFPKGKKVKQGDEVDVKQKFEGEEDADDLINPLVAKNAAKERAKRRNRIAADLINEENVGVLEGLSDAEVSYEDDENFVDDGIQIEPFNLNKEKEEGKFDEAGNYIEFIRDNEIKDAWLDNVEVDPRYAALSSVATNDEEEIQELTSKDIGTMKRRIANVLEPGETVLQALRRLKGSSDRKSKMSTDTKIVFDQLTEDAMKLMENGEYNVYHEKKEVFVREAEGYEKLARAKGEDTSPYSGEGNSLFSDVAPASFPATAVGTSNPDLTSKEVSGHGAGGFDMFAEDDDDAAPKPPTNENNQISQLSSNPLNSGSDGGALQNDYVYDESSGYYYSSSQGYYYDPNTGLYGSAESGQWYSFNEETGAYDEVQEVASSAS